MQTIPAEIYTSVKKKLSILSSEDGGKHHQYTSDQNE
jgi:hypothetical protein